MNLLPFEECRHQRALFGVYGQSTLRWDEGCARSAGRQLYIREIVNETHLKPIVVL
jgi:hypothetical protein